MESNNSTGVNIQTTVHESQGTLVVVDGDDSVSDSIHVEGFRVKKTVLVNFREEASEQCRKTESFVVEPYLECLVVCVIFVRLFVFKKQPFREVSVAVFRKF